MDNFKIISNNEIKKVDEIISAKKLKTRGGDFNCIKEAGIINEEPVVEKKPVIEEPEFVPVKPKIEIKEEKKKDESKDEDITFAYGLRKQEKDIDLDDITRIKNIGDSYKGGNPKEDIKKVEVAKKEEKKKEEPKLTKEQYEKEIKVDAYSERIAKFIKKVYEGYTVILDNIFAKEQEINNITNEYARETECGTKLQESKKENQNVLKGINDWNLDFLTLRKNDENTKSLLSHIEGYFETNRQVLNHVLQEIRNNDERKEALGKSEQRAREELAGLKKQLQEYMEKTYPEIKEANRTDAELKETDAKITELTGIEAEEPKLNIVDVQNTAYEPERTRVTDVRNLNETIQFTNPSMISNGMGQGRVA